MGDIYPPTMQRPALLELVKALGCRDNALRRDECGDWRVNGKQGHIYAVPGSLNRPKTPGFQIYIERESVREWSYAKKVLKPFADLTNDGDDDGMLFLDRLPTVNEAEVIRQYVGIAKKRAMTEETLAHLAEVRRPFAKRSGVGGDDQREKQATDDLAGIPAPTDQDDSPEAA
jgi:hypothetical protein